MFDIEKLEKAELELEACQPKALRRRPRMACLHGGAGNASVFRRQLEKLMTHLADDVEVFFPEGALLSEEVRCDERGRKLMKLIHTFFGEDQVLREHAVTRYGPAGEQGPFYYDCLDEGIYHLERVLTGLPDDARPPDVLLGFSQGANMITILSARASLGCDNAIPPPRCVVLLENDRPGWPEQKPRLFDAPVPIPALVVGGHPESEAADAITKLFSNVVGTRHKDGHRPLPKDPAACEMLVKQVRDFIFEHCPLEQIY